MGDARRITRVEQGGTFVLDDGTAGRLAPEAGGGGGGGGGEVPAADAVASTDARGGATAKEPKVYKPDEEDVLNIFTLAKVLGTWDAKRGARLDGLGAVRVCFCVRHYCACVRVIIIFALCAFLPECDAVRACVYACLYVRVRGTCERAWSACVQRAITRRFITTAAGARRK